LWFPSYTIDAIINNSLFTLGQCMMFTEFFLIVLVWSDIVEATKKMKAMDKEADKRKYRRATIFITLIFVVLYPLFLLSYAIPVLFYVFEFLAISLVLSLLVGGLRYANSLRALLSTGGNAAADEKKKKAIQNIMFVCYLTSFQAMICTTAVVLDALGTFHPPVARVWGWWFVLGFNSVVFLFLFSYSTSYKARAAYFEGRTLANFFKSEGNSNPTLHSKVIDVSNTSENMEEPASKKVTNTNLKNGKTQTNADM